MYNPSNVCTAPHRPMLRLASNPPRSKTPKSMLSLTRISFFGSKHVRKEVLRFSSHEDCKSTLCCRRLLAFEFAIDDGGLTEVGVLFSSLAMPGVLARASRCD